MFSEYNKEDMMIITMIMINLMIMVIKIKSIKISK